jgi:hypothetical protein
VANTSATWAVNAVAGTITFTIVDNHLLGDTFALSWAMTCANDIIEGQVILPPSVNVGGVPEPTTWAMMIMGFATLGVAAHRRKKRNAVVAT